MRSRLKIFLSAYACEPGKGSEPEVGWQWTRVLSSRCEVTLLTRSNNRETIEATGLPDVEVLYHDLPRFFRKLKKKQILSVPIYYLLWQLSAFWKFRHKAAQADIVHHLTFNSFLLPGFWSLLGKPVVAGPLGGGMIAPKRHLKWFGHARLRELVRSLSIFFATYCPLTWVAYRNTFVLVANRDTQKCFWFLKQPPPIFLETGVQPEQFVFPHRNPEANSLRVLWVGRIEPRKALPLALAAMAHVVARLPLAKLMIVGDGPDFTQCRQISSEMGLDGNIEWMGKLSKADTQVLFSKADIFLFTSLRDTSGNVVLEAMASGIPVVALDHHGAAEMVNTSCGVKVSLDTDRLDENLAEAIMNLAADDIQREILGNGGRHLAKTIHSWESKGDAMLQFYKNVLSKDAMFQVLAK